MSTNVCAYQFFKELKDEYGIYEYYRINTEHLGNYCAFQHKGRDHMKEEIVNDIEALACYFSKELGLKANDVFSIFLPTSAESIFSFFALNKLGVIVNFIHPLLPADNVKEIMEFTKSKGIIALDVLMKDLIPFIAQKKFPCIVCSPATYAVEDKFSVQPHEGIKAALDTYVKDYETYNNIIKKYSGQSVETLKNNGSGIAVYMNGGGTTGKSKTIKLSNSALNNVACKCCRINRPLEEVGIDTEIASMPFFHAFGLCAGGLSGMLKGSKMVFVPQFDPDVFIDIMKREKVTEFNGVPNVYKKLYAHPEFDGPHLKNIKALFCGADDISVDFLTKFREVLKKNGSDATICQGYGLTECGAVCCVNPVWANRDGSIGQPLPGNVFEIWDDDNNEVPIGEIGEIVMRGNTMMEGYLTENGPIDDGIFTAKDGTRWIKSGDLAYRDADNYYYFVGRKKRVIIISGYNVYPRDIERLMTELPFIKECCAVQGVVDGKPIVRLYTVLETPGDEEDYKRQITELCAAKLSKFSVPRDIRFIDELPRTRVQKVDFMKLTEELPKN
ncbi:MAG: AMP-binding protein [Clostridia bacterium]|nr:AMP-binding protein [Clostridia bacterium]